MTHGAVPALPTLRSLLFVPGNQVRMLRKALDLAPDAYVPDLEDSVPDAEKGTARSIVAGLLPELAQAGPLVVPRVNAMESGLLEADLHAVIGPHTFGVSAGKVGAAAEVDALSQMVERVERDKGVEPGSTRLVLWLESALAVVNAYAVCAASARTVAAAFGAEDFTNDMDIQRRDDDAEIAYARSAVSVAARAAGVPGAGHALLPLPRFRRTERRRPRGPNVRLPRKVRHPSGADRRPQRGLLAVPG